MRTLVLPLALVVLPLSTACGPRGETEPAGIGCDATTTEYALGEVTPTGFSGADILALAEGAHEADAEWANREEFTFSSVRIASPEGAVVRFVDEEPADFGGGLAPAIDIQCEDRIEIDTNINFSTEDGGFNESGLAATLIASQADRVVFRVALDEAGLGGSWTAEDIADSEPFDSSAWDEVSISLEGTVQPELYHARVSFQAHREDGMIAEAMMGDILRINWDEAGF